MKNILLIGVLFLSAGLKAQSVDTLATKASMSIKEDTTNSTVFFIQNWHNNTTGKRRIKADTAVAITSASGQVIDISRFGYTNLASMNVQATILNNTALATSGLLTNVKSFSTTSVTMNTFGISTVLGTLFPGNVTGVTVHLRIEGY